MNLRPLKDGANSSILDVFLFVFSLKKPLFEMDQFFGMLLNQTDPVSFLLFQYQPLIFRNLNFVSPARRSKENYHLIVPEQRL
jgi:hypothetical protein